MKIHTLFITLMMTFIVVSGFAAQGWAYDGNESYSLTFDLKNFKRDTATVDGHAFVFRVYENVVYVTKPVDAKYQCMNIYIPEAFFKGETLNGFTASTAPIFLPNSIGGYMQATPGKASLGRDGKPNAALMALSKGLVVAAPGARGRELKTNGKYYGKAPACIVDLKAAVRYLRFNDATMPGDAEKIISNGTSAGGALSALLGASGNCKDYEPYLEAIGAADARDDIYAVSAYCPITNLDHADAAYEWLFNGVNTYERMMGKMGAGGLRDFAVDGQGFPKHPDSNKGKNTHDAGIPAFPQKNMPNGGGFPDFQGGKIPALKSSESNLTKHQIAVSAKLKTQFVNYVNSLNLKSPQGSELSLDAKGNGSFKDYVLFYVTHSAELAASKGEDLTKYEWLTIKSGNVTAIDFDKYVRYAKRMKTPPAFDALDLSAAENSLFGDETIAARHFTDFSYANASIKGDMLADRQLVKMMNPMNFIGNNNSKPAKHWRIRHGTIDRDGSIAIPIILATKLDNCGYDVNLSLPWNIPHSGDYDLEELFSWIFSICR